MNGSWPTLLHVEDDPGDKELLEQACRSARIALNLRWVGDGQTAIDYLEGKGAFSDRGQFPFPSLVLLDIKMPRRSGLEVLQWVRSSAQTRGLPVITLSASNNPLDVSRAFELGANSFIMKPSTYKGLVEVVQSLFHYWFETNVLPAMNPTARARSRAEPPAK
jgi:CheY-like chemotaxis protein